MPARQAFALARIIVVPSRAEAMPYIVLEALAAGKPMIATAVGGIPEIFGTGLACAGRGPMPASSADKMAEALADPAAFRALMPAGDDLEAPLRRRRDGRTRSRQAYFERAPSALRRVQLCSAVAQAVSQSRPFGFKVKFLARFLLSGRANARRVTAS